MDLNFLVFPKPSFRCQSDVFYSRLLFVPKQHRQIKNLVLKKASMLNRSSDRESLCSEGEGRSNVPFARHSFDFSKFKGATAPLLHMPASKASDCELEDEEHDVNIKQEVRACEKQVRLPRHRNASSIFKLVGAVAKERQPNQPTRVADIRKLAIQSSRFTSHPKPASANQGTLSRLMHELDTFKRNKPSEFKLISQLERKFKKADSKGSSTEKLKPVLVEDKSFDAEFEPPVERPTLIQDKFSFGVSFNSPPKAAPMRIFPQRSLHQLKGSSNDPLDEDPKIGPLQRFGTRPLIKRAKDRSRSNLSSVIVQPDPLEEVARLQSPQHIMPKYNRNLSRSNKLGDLFSKRKIELSKHSVFVDDGIGSRTEAQMSIRVKADSAATRNKSMLENPLNETESIPCLLMKPEFPSDVVLLYFHANGEDIQQCQFFCELLKASLNVSLAHQCWVVTMEYPGYSVYKASEISEEIIIKDSEAVMHYLVHKCKVALPRVLVMGRSLGSGPACWVAKNYEVAGLILISPFISIKEVASHHYGVFGSLFIKNRFDNLENIKAARCPTLIIHGMLDDVVPVRHSDTLRRTLCSLEHCGGKCLLVKPEGMSHNITNFQAEVREPLYEFLYTIRFSLNPLKPVYIK